MMLSFALALLAAASTWALLQPLLRRPAAPEPRFAHELAIYRDQLAELERDIAAARIAPADGVAARVEIERRILAAADRNEAVPRAATPVRALPWLVALFVPLAALALYFEIGQPELPAQPFAARPAVPSRDDEIERILATLRKNVQDAPDDTSRALVLARALTASNRAAEAVEVLREAIRRGAAGSEPLAQLAEALTLAADGVVVPEAKALFERVLAERSGDPRSRYYLGRAEEQAGDSRAALARWLALEAEAPVDAPWLATLTAEIERVAKASGIDPKSIRPDRRVRTASEAPRPSREDVERLQRMTPQEREQAIRGMVEGLEQRLQAQPDDLAGWRRLGDAWKQLGEFGRARAAFEQADRLKPDDPAILADLAETMLQGGDPKARLSAEVVAVLRRLEKAQPDHGLALFYLAEDAAQSGDKAGAATRFRRLLAMIPPDAPLRAVVERRLKEVE